METSDCKLGSQGPNSGGRSGLHDHVASSSQGLLNILLQRERALVSPRDCTAPVFPGMIHTHPSSHSTPFPLKRLLCWRHTAFPAAGIAGQTLPPPARGCPYPAPDLAPAVP